MSKLTLLSISKFSVITVCQKLIEQLHLTRFGAQWLRQNSSLFHAPVDIPLAVDEDDVCHAVQLASSFEQLRDLTLINFSDLKDFKLFMKLVINGLGVAACVCLSGLEYISSNTSDLWL